MQKSVEPNEKPSKVPQNDQAAVQTGDAHAHVPSSEKGEASQAEKRRIKRRWLDQLKRVPWLLLYPLAIWLSRQASKHPEFVENVYSRHIYPVISSFVGMISSWVPFSVAEFIVYALILFVIILLVVCIVRLIKRKFSPLRAVSFLLTLCIVGGVCFNLFYVMWGFNYSRPSLYELMDLPVEQRPVEQLETLCYALSDKAAELRKSLYEDESGVFSMDASISDCFKKIPAAYERLGKTNDLFANDVYPAKSVLASVAMSYSGIAGIFIPFTIEANVNTAQPALLLYVSAAHETAHSLGIAPEDEANFTAYLACINADDASIAYSGVMLALINCGNRLSEHDMGKYSALRDTYTDAINRDLADYDNYWEQYDGPVEEAVNNMNDNYLKFNQQESGVNSYGMMVDLLLAYYFSTQV